MHGTNMKFITHYLVPYHCRALNVSKAECKAIPEEFQLSSRSVRIKASEFSGRGVELPRQIQLIYVCSALILITIQFSASGKRKVNKNILWFMCNMREQVYCFFFQKTCAKTKPSEQKSYVLSYCIFLYYYYYCCY